MAFAAEGIDRVAVHGGCGVRAAFIHVRIDWTRIGMSPKFFARVRVKAINHLGAALIAQRIKPVMAYSDGGEAGANR